MARTSHKRFRDGYPAPWSNASSFVMIERPAVNAFSPRRVANTRLRPRHRRRPARPPSA